MENGDHHAIEIESITELPTGSTNEIEGSMKDSFTVRMQRHLAEIRREVGEGNHLAKEFNSSFDPVCIYRVPQSLRGIGSSLDVEPEIVSIGPYHRDKEDIQEFESYKWQFLDSFLLRAEPRGVDVWKLMEAMKALESKARSCYSEPIPMPSDDFVEMMLLDGCFIVELFLQVCGNSKDSIRFNSPILKKPWQIPILSRDLLKLENQLPLAVLQTLFDLSIGDTSDDSLNLLALKFFNLVLPRSLGSIKRSASSGSGGHLLGFFHSSYCRPAMQRRFDADRLKNMQRINHRRTQSDQSMPCVTRLRATGGKIARRIGLRTRENECRPESDQSMPCVTRLRAAGGKFRPRQSYESFLEINFCKGVLEIPPITINDFTNTIFINCAALEQCHPCIKKCFSAYIAFMSCLIGSSKDVAFLCDDGIITNFSHTDPRIALFFKKLGENVVFKFKIRDCYLSNQFRGVEAYYASNWATLRRTYFSSPWSLISVVSASVLLTLTVIQSVMAILSYRIHHS